MTFSEPADHAENQSTTEQTQPVEEVEEQESAQHQEETSEQAPVEDYDGTVDDNLDDQDVIAAVEAAQGWKYSIVCVCGGGSEYGMCTSTCCHVMNFPVSVVLLGVLSVRVFVSFDL